MPTEEVTYGDPPYAELKCPKCGEQREFIEASHYDGRQPFTRNPKKPKEYPDFGCTDVDWDSGIPFKVECGVCDALVWSSDPDDQPEKPKG